MAKAKLAPQNDLSTFTRAIKDVALRFAQWSTGTYGYRMTDKLDVGGASFQMSAPLYIVGTKGSSPLPTDELGNQVPPEGLPQTVTFGDLSLNWQPYVNPDTHTASIRALGKTFPAVLGGVKCQATMYAYVIGSSDLSQAERKAISDAKVAAKAAAR